MGLLVRREERSGGGLVLHLTIDNEARLNSLGRALLQEIVAGVLALAEEPGLRLVILSGAGERALPAAPT